MVQGSILTLNLTESHNTTVGNKHVINTGPRYIYGIAAWAASQAWLGMGGQGINISVRGVPDSILGQTTPFWSVSFK